MRLLLAVLSICVGLVGMGKSAEAQNYPWCAMLNMGDQAVNCGLSIPSNAWPMSGGLVGTAW